MTDAPERIWADPKLRDSHITDIIATKVGAVALRQDGRIDALMEALSRPPRTVVHLPGYKKPQIERVQPWKASIKRLARAWAEAENVAYCDLMEDDKRPEVVHVRQDFWRFVYESTDASFQLIADVFDKHPSTVQYGVGQSALRVRQFQRKMERDARNGPWVFPAPPAPSVETRKMDSTASLAKTPATTHQLTIVLPPRPPFVVAGELLQSVADKHRVTVSDLKGRSRRRDIGHARQEAMTTVRDVLGWSLPRIGRLLGNRDHTTILEGIKQHRARERERQRMAIGKAGGYIG